ncbi:MAG: hypothetical protein HYW06_02715 [Gemmatimonadetes bacterium]|nr:hypothetical protein [Gemmatimonadota bacterium]MBI2401356.1 hypothetical protein [Gemmatimonadota bacterium]MBI2535884.1 hypothetical protein [Gemmatimonadota bacterium]
MRKAVLRDSVVAVVDARQRQQAALTIQRQTLEADIRRHRDSVIALARRRAAAQLTVRRLRTVGALQDQLRAAFPELGDGAWGVTTLPFEDADTLGLEYLLVPAWFAETFAIDRGNPESWRAQKDQLLAVDSLRLVITAFQDSVTRLVAANAAAYQAGYQAAYTGYQDLSQRFVAKLKKPRIRLRSAVALLGTAGAGLVIGRTIRE